MARTRENLLYTLGYSFGVVYYFLEGYKNTQLLPDEVEVLLQTHESIMHCVDGLGKLPDGTPSKQVSMSALRTLVLLEDHFLGTWQLDKSALLVRMRECLEKIDIDVGTDTDTDTDTDTYMTDAEHINKSRESTYALDLNKNTKKQHPIDTDTYMVENLNKFGAVADPLGLSGSTTKQHPTTTKEKMKLERIEALLTCLLEDLQN